MSRRRCCCGSTCNITVNVKGCNSANRQGATVRLKNGATVISTGTTDSSGNVTLNATGHAGFLRSIVVDADATVGYASITTIITVACGGSYSITTVADANHVCCPSCNYPVPKMLYMTDAVGTLAFTYIGRWLAQRIISGATGNVVAPNCLFGSTTTTDMKIYYEMTCGAGGFTLTRTWDIVNDTGCGDVGGTWYYCQFPPGCSGVTGCGNYPFTPYNPAADTVTGTATSSCNPLSLSFSLSGTTKLSDPVGGGVTVTP